MNADAAALELFEAIKKYVDNRLEEVKEKKEETTPKIDVDVLLKQSEVTIFDRLLMSKDVYVCPPHERIGNLATGVPTGESINDVNKKIINCYDRMPGGPGNPLVASVTLDGITDQDAKEVFGCMDPVQINTCGCNCPRCPEKYESMKINQTDGECGPGCGLASPDFDAKCIDGFKRLAARKAAKVAQPDASAVS